MDMGSLDNNVYGRDWNLSSSCDPFAYDDDSSSSCSSTLPESDDSEKCASLDQCIDACTLAQLVHGHRSKRQRTEAPDKDLRPIAFVRFNTSRGKMKPITIRALLDSGATETLACEKHTKKLKLKTTLGKKTAWSTPGGTLTTSRMTKAQFTLPESHDDKLLEWNVHVTKDLGNYDMIMQGETSSVF